MRPGPADLWTSVWLALVAFAAERVSAKEWSPDHPQVGLTIEAHYTIPVEFFGGAYKYVWKFDPVVSRPTFAV